MRNKQHIYSHRTKFNRFLRILSFGTEKDIDRDDAECLLPTSKDDAIFEKIERNETRNKILIDIRKRKSLEKILSYKNWPKLLFIYSYSSLSDLLSS